MVARKSFARHRRSSTRRGENHSNMRRHTERSLQTAHSGVDASIEHAHELRLLLTHSQSQGSRSTPPALLRREPSSWPAPKGWKNVPETCGGGYCSLLYVGVRDVTKLGIRLWTKPRMLAEPQPVASCAWQCRARKTFSRFRADLRPVNLPRFTAKI